MNIQKFTTLKTILIALVFTISANQLFAQTTNGIFFQAVARDNFSNPAKDRKIYVQSSIIQTTPTGTKVLTEEHQANTDATGVFSISLGNGVRVGGAASSLTTIDWSKGPYYLNLKIAITPIGGNSNWDYTKEWVDMGTTSFGAVPFALYSASSAKVDDKLNANDTTKMLAVYAKAIKVQSLETAVASKLTAADTLTMLAPYAKAAYTIDSSFFKSQLATKLSLTDTIKYTKQKYTDSAIAKKLNIADSAIYVTKTQLASYNFSSSGTSTTTTSVTMDTTSLSNRINLKANTTDLTALNTNIASNTASITVNATAINLKAPIASPLFTGTVAIGTTNPSSAAALDITSTSQGLLLPRLTYVQKTAITSPVAGLVLWCSDCGTSGEMQLYNGTSFVNMIGGTAQFALPVISSTTGAYSITTSAAMSGGVITSDGGSNITARGVVWGTSTAPTIALATKTTDGTGTGTYSSSITGLTSGVTYYVRAYATNSIGTKYGEEITLNTAQAVATLAATTPVSAIGSTTATSGGNITYNGGATVTVSGVVWSTTSTPTISDSKTTDGVANGTYTSTITGLNPGTLYYVRSFATNSVGTSYGAQTSFTTLNTATISVTASATSITSSTATTGGTITADGGASVTSRGVVYGTSSLSSTFSVTSGTGTGTYTSSLTGLNPATTYFVRSFATNSVGTVYGTETSFTTIAVEPTISETSAAASISGSSATSGGTISSNGGSIITVSGIVWSTTSFPTIALVTKTTNGAISGTYTSSITGLSPATLYYVRAYATNSIGTAYGPESSFTTLAIAPTIAATTSATSITSSTATTGGNITLDGGATVTSRGVVYGITAGSATYSTTSGTGTGTYTISLTGLTPATTYFVRSFVTNSVGTVYGAETSFTTIAIAPILTTTAASSITKYAASAGGTITSNGGSVITASGICWSTTATPTTSDFKTTDGTTSGTFTNSLTGLTAGTTYYVRAYATNAIGTSYGTAQSFTTSSLALILPTIGSSYGGGKVAYVYQNGDPGYSSSNIPVLIAANADQVGNLGSGTALWSISGASGVAQKVGLIGSSYEALGAGLSNTNAIITAYGTGNYAAKFARDYTDGTYNDWYMPSINELGKLYLNRVAIGGFSTQYYWSSTEVQETPTQISGYSWSFNGSGNDKHMDTKAWNMKIRAVRTTIIVPSKSSSPILGATTSAASITSSSAILGGNVSDEGSTEVSVRGLLYGTSTGSSTFSVTIGSGAGTFTSTLTGLAQGTTYFVRSFATNVQGTSYGAETSFTTQTTPTVSATATPSNLTITSAIGGGTILNTGGATITTSGLVWNLTVNPTTALATKTTDGATSGTFTSSITGLTQGTLYHVRAYATNYLGTSYGPGITFTTLTLPTVSATATISSISGTSATGGGTITSDGGATITTRGVVWGTTTGSSTFSATSGTGTGSYVSNLSGLTPATTYYVRAFATNSVGTVYGTETSFTTSAGPASKAMITTEPSGAAAGTAFTTQPVIRITDLSGNTVTTSTVNVVASIASGTGTLSGTTSVTAVNGVATFTNLVLSGATGNFTLAFTPTSLTAATSNSFALSVGTVSKAMITTQPSGAAAGTAFTTQPVVRITDLSGNTVTTSTVNVVASIASGTGTLSGTTTVAAVNGVATFTDLALSGTAGNFTVTFTPTSLIAATSNSFALSFGAASQAMISTQPSGAFNGIAFSTQPIVKITDAGKNTITSSTASVVATIASGSGTLNGTTAVAAVNGVATFTNLKITGTGNHTLTFTPAGGLTAATSNTLNIAELGCAQGGTCAIGETGPGGGTVFYYSAAGFNCGASFTSTGSPTGGQCHYLEYAPAGWNGPQADPYAYWSPNTTTSVGATSTAIGSGYKNSELMRVNDGTLYHPDGRPYAGAYIRSKTLGGKSDWYLPSKDELNQLCKWARGLPATTPDIEADGTAGTLSSINNPSTGWVQDHYWSSSENAPSKAYSKDFRGNTVYLGKIWNFVIRPIRAF